MFVQAKKMERSAEAESQEYRGKKIHPKGRAKGIPNREGTRRKTFLTHLAYLNNLPSPKSYAELVETL